VPGEAIPLASQKLTTGSYFDSLGIPRLTVRPCLNPPNAPACPVVWEEWSRGFPLSRLVGVRLRFFFGLIALSENPPWPAIRSVLLRKTAVQ
jgi:hypothetical protein